MSDTSTYAIEGLPRPEDAPRKTKGEDGIPYAPNLPVRYEITKLATSEDETLRKQWTLFVLGLEKFKKMPVNEKLSYFQIAGIHSYPQQVWDNAPRGDQDGFDYCFHGKLNFGPWHRPYMLLFERALYENMKKVVEEWVTKTGQLKDEENKFKDAATWFKAADNWRLPYWDWALHQSYAQDFAYPKVFTTRFVRIYPPTELAQFFTSTREYPSPFWTFENPETYDNGDPRPFGQMPEDKKAWNIQDRAKDKEELKGDETALEKQLPWGRCTSTSRYGLFINKSNTDYLGFDGVNNFTEGNKSLSAARILTKYDPENKKNPIYDGNPPSTISPDAGNLADSVNRMFTPQYNKNWLEFATNRFTDDDKSTGHMSLEHIHNMLHVLTGGSKYQTGVGHMSDVPVAAFDPIFWFHHCQVDRLLAMWQCLYPKIWFDVGTPAKGEDDDEETLMQPFHTTNDGKVFKSKDCRDWTTFNYQYDDLLALSYGATVEKDGTLDEPFFQEKLRRHINSIYPSTASVVNTAKKEDSAPEGLLTPVTPGTGKKQKEWKDYIINVLYDRYAYGGRSYSIEFFLGGPKDKKITKFKERNYVGQIYNFAGNDISSEGGCANCKKQAKDGFLYSGQIPLTTQLLHHANDKLQDHPIDDMTDIDKYLELHLQWRYVGLGGSILDPKDFSKTVVKVLKGHGQLGEIKNAPVLPPPEVLQPDVEVPAAQVAAAQEVGALNVEISALQVNAEEPPKSVPAVYFGYEVITEATKGKEGLDSTLDQVPVPVPAQA